MTQHSSVCAAATAAAAATAMAGTEAGVGAGAGAGAAGCCLRGVPKGPHLPVTTPGLKPLYLQKQQQQPHACNECGAHSAGFHVPQASNTFTPGVVCASIPNKGLPRLWMVGPLLLLSPPTFSCCPQRPPTPSTPSFPRSSPFLPPLHLPASLGVLIKEPGHLARPRVHVGRGDVLAGANNLLDGLVGGGGGEARGGGGWVMW